MTTVSPWLVCNQGNHPVVNPIKSTQVKIAKYISINLKPGISKLWVVENNHSKLFSLRAQMSGKLNEAIQCENRNKKGYFKPS